MKTKRKGIREFGFVRVATAVPTVKVADCPYNAEQIVLMLSRAANERADIVVFPELSLTGYSCADLFQQVTLQRGALVALETVRKASEKVFAGLVFVGLPVALDDQIFNCAAVIQKGKILGILPKTCLPNYKEFYEDRWFAPASNARSRTVKIGGRNVPFGTDLLFEAENMDALVVGAEICEDLWMSVPPSALATLNGATVMVNLSASNELIGKADYRRQLVAGRSSASICAYAYVSCGSGESTTDVVFGGHAIISENGAQLSEAQPLAADTSFLVSDVDVEKLRIERQRQNSFGDSLVHLGLARQYRRISFTLDRSREATGLTRSYEAHPFVPKTSAALSGRCKSIFAIQVEGLVKRLRKTGTKRVAIGVSGGLDSTLALLVTVKAFKKLGLPLVGIQGITMPGFGTTSRTKNNAHALMAELGTSVQEVDIKGICFEQMRAMGHKPFGIDLATVTLDEFMKRLLELPAGSQDLVFENVQARARTSILMNTGFVIGTGDLSELALGWCTYNGDHMSMYNVNVSIPKTLVKFLVGWAAYNEFENETRATLADIVGTEISPELLPTSKDGKITQKTEGVVGPYELHDFFLYHMLRSGASPEKILFLAQHATFDKAYTFVELARWLKTYIGRFFGSQFKRSCLPDGPKVGSVSLSPRGDWRMPSDAEATLWLEWAAGLDLNPPPADGGSKKEKAVSETKRALFNVDGTNDFADYEATETHPKSLLPVPGGRAIGPVIGKLQDEGKKRGIYAVQGGVRDSHSDKMFNFGVNCPDKREYLDKVPDRDGVATTVFPLHMIPDTWGWDWIEGTRADLFDRLFRKGEAIDKDEFSGARPEVIAWLRENNITHVDLVGLVLRICVGLTAIDLVNAGFKVRVITDATCDLPAAADMAFVLDEMKRLGVEMVTSAEVLA